MFTTNAQEADYAFMLTRTDPEVGKHQGLTTFLVPLRQPGVEIRPVHTLSGERTNLTFYSDVRVDDSLRIGEVDGGWDVMQVGLTLERAGDHGGESIRLLAAMEQWATDSVDEDGRRKANDPGVRARLGRAAAENEVTTLPIGLDPCVGWDARGRGLNEQTLRLGGPDPAVGRLRGPARPRRDP
jgi:alkylation response protein AidB-like acyl-CoA dehydrogenase